MSQDERVLDYLKVNGSIQPLQAWTELGVYRLAACIFRLRKTTNITTGNTAVTNQFGEKCRVATYYLEH